MSTDSLWTDNDLGHLITEILREAAVRDDAHHFGASFMTAYQLAILIKARHPEVFESFGRPLGGRGSGDHVGFAQRLGGQLSRRINSGQIDNIEGRFLSYDNVQRLEFDDDGDTVVASTGNPHVSMFRYREPGCAG